MRPKSHAVEQGGPKTVDLLSLIDHTEDLAIRTWPGSPHRPLREARIDPAEFEALIAQMRIAFPEAIRRGSHVVEIPQLDQ